MEEISKIIIELSDGDFFSGFYNTTINIVFQEDIAFNKLSNDRVINANSTFVSCDLGPAPKIPLLYQDWQDKNPEVVKVAEKFILANCYNPEYVKEYLENYY